MELTKEPIIRDFAEIRLRIPRENEASIQQVIENMLALANIHYSIHTEWHDDDAVSLEEAFPDLHCGSAIRGLRDREDLTQQQLAEKIGVPRRHVSEMEHGKRPISQDMAKRLANALRTDYRVFL